MMKNKSFHNHKAFTLAEVLVVIGIIGIVAMIIIPLLINKYQKNVTLARLKEAYSIVSQAVELSEIDNGPVESWNIPMGDPMASVNIFHTYFEPYLKNIQQTIYITPLGDSAPVVILNNGSTIRFWDDSTTGQLHITVFTDDPNNKVYGQNAFVFLVGSAGAPSTHKPVRPYDWGLPANATRSTWMNDPSYGCLSGAQKLYCTGVIIMDGWQFSSDYPYFN